MCVRLHPPGRTDEILCRCFGAPARRVSLYPINWSLYCPSVVRWKRPSPAAPARRTRTKLHLQTRRPQERPAPGHPTANDGGGRYAQVLHVQARRPARRLLPRQCPGVRLEGPARAQTAPCRAGGAEDCVQEPRHPVLRVSLPRALSELVPNWHRLLQLARPRHALCTKGPLRGQNHGM